MTTNSSIRNQHETMFPCGHCQQKKDTTLLSNYPAKLIITYGDRKVEGRQVISDASVENKQQLCTGCLNSVKIMDKNAQLISNMDVFFVPSLKFGKFYNKYGDWCDFYQVKLDQVGDYFVCTRSGYGPYLTHDSQRELLVSVDFFEKKEFNSAQYGKYTSPFIHKTSNNRYNPCNTNVKKIGCSMPTPDASPYPVEYNTSESHSNSRAIPDLDVDMINESNKENKNISINEKYLQKLKQFNDDSANPFAPDSRSEKAKKKKKRCGVYTYGELNCMLDAMESKAGYGTVRDLSAVIFGTVEFQTAMISKSFPNRGAKAWNTCWRDKLMTKKHVLLLKTEEKEFKDEETGQPVSKKVPTEEAMDLWIKIIKIKKKLNESRIKKFEFGNSGADALQHAANTMNNGGIIVPGPGSSGPLEGALKQHKTLQDQKAAKKDRWFILRQEEFAWKKQNAKDKIENHSQLATVLGQLSTTAQDLEKQEEIGEWLLGLPENCLFGGGKFNAFDMLGVVQKSIRKYALLWTICKKKNYDDKKRIELFEKAMKSQK